jgi:hypothetical protein
MVTPVPASSVKPVWAYAYELSPPQTAERLRTIQSLLDDADSAARRDAYKWVGRVVSEERVTHILVVSDSPDQTQDGNRRLESALRELGAGFSISAPMALP